MRSKGSALHVCSVVHINVSLRSATMLPVVLLQCENISQHDSGATKMSCHECPIVYGLKDRVSISVLMPFCALPMLQGPSQATETMQRCFLKDFKAIAPQKSLHSTCRCLYARPSTVANPSCVPAMLLVCGRNLLTSMSSGTWVAADPYLDFRSASESFWKSLRSKGLYLEA